MGLFGTIGELHGLIRIRNFCSLIILIFFLNSLIFQFYYQDIFTLTKKISIFRNIVSLMDKLHSWGFLQERLELNILYRITEGGDVAFVFSFLLKYSYSIIIIFVSIFISIVSRNTNLLKFITFTISILILSVLYINRANFFSGVFLFLNELSALIVFLGAICILVWIRGRKV